MSEPVPAPESSDSGGPPALEALLGSEDPGGTFEVVLELLRARSLVRVGLALLARFPAEADQEQVFDEPEFLAAAARFAQARRAVRDGMAAGSPEAVARVALQAYPEAVEAVVVLADRLGCEPEDLVSVMLGA